MKKFQIFLVLQIWLCFLIIPCFKSEGQSLSFPQEKHLANMRQLTFGGKNAEAYFSFDGKKLVFQATRNGFQCDQIFIMNDDGSDIHLVSTGKGQTTCAYFFPDGKRILYSSTHPINPDCPSVQERKGLSGLYSPMKFSRRRRTVQI